MDRNQYDVLVVGGGPAGYAAALYCARAGLSVLVLEQLAPGGQMGTTDQVDNYPGFPQGINGFDLAMQMQQGAERFGAKSCMEQVTSFKLDGKEKTVVTTEQEYHASCVILAVGASPRELGLPGERELRGRGVSYCATCDGMFYKGKTVAVIGGGDTAAADAVFLCKICKKVYLIHRRDTLRASKAYQNPLKGCENLEIVWDSTVDQILHDERLHGILIQNKKSGEKRALSCDGMFVAVGNVPNTELLRGLLNLDKAGYILADETTKTSIPGVFAAGDVRKKPLRQIVTAVSDGAVAAHFAEEYLTIGAE